MTTTILQDRRDVRAAGICERQECEILDNGAWRVRDTATGSGRWHTVFQGHCTCADYLTRGATCKHLRAVAAEETALAQYCVEWNARSTEARADVDHDELPGDFLDTGLDFADDVLLAEPARDEYAGPYGSDGWPQPRPCCPECGAELETRSYWVGGKGYTAFLCCTKDVEHRALPA